MQPILTVTVPVEKIKSVAFTDVITLKDKLGCTTCSTHNRVCVVRSKVPPVNVMVTMTESLDVD